MAQILQETRMDLQHSEIVELSISDRHSLRCETGELWVTFDGSSEDVILRAGASLELDGRRGVVISALKPARLFLTTSPSSLAVLLERSLAPWHWARRLRWKYPCLASFPVTQLR